MPYECSILEVVRWLAAANNSLWRWLAASVLGHVLEDGTCSLVRRDRGRRGRRRAARRRRCSRSSHDADGVTVRTGGSAPAEHRAAAAVVALPLNCLGDVPFDPAARRRQARRGARAPRGTRLEGLGARATRRPRRTSASAGWAARASTSSAPRRSSRTRRCSSASRPTRALAQRGPRRDRGARSGSSCPARRCSSYTCHDWADDPYARGTWNAFRPGRSCATRRRYARARAGSCSPASHTALLWPSFIDGAVESGLRAGAEAAALLEAAADSTSAGDGRAGARATGALGASAGGSGRRRARGRQLGDADGLARHVAGDGLVMRRDRESLPLPSIESLNSRMP